MPPPRSLPTFALVLAGIATTTARTVLSDLHYATGTRVLSARWTPVVSAAAISEALDGHFEFTTDSEAQQICDELKQRSAFVREMHVIHGDAFRGAQLVQVRIQKALEAIGHAMRRAHDEEAAGYEDAVATTFDGLW
jgi:hypothetical protein